MPIEPFFSLSPNSPRPYTYDPAHPTSPYAYAFLIAYGGVTFEDSTYSLPGQFTNNEILVGPIGVDPADHTIGPSSGLFYNGPVFLVRFAGFNVPSGSQYLLLMQLNGVFPTNAQIFVGTHFIGDYYIDGTEQLAILIDVPVPSDPYYPYLSLIIRAAVGAPIENLAALGFRGLDCYLL